MIRGHKDHFLSRVRERGYVLSQVQACVVRAEGDIWTVDDNHPAYPRAKPGVAKRAANFVVAAAGHIASGARRATDEQVAARFAICQGCEQFDGKGCARCGCAITPERKIVSKLSWAEQECPVGKWGAV
jgi:hypothetical protein